MASCGPLGQRPLSTIRWAQKPGRETSVVRLSSGPVRAVTGILVPVIRLGYPRTEPGTGNWVSRAETASGLLRSARSVNESPVWADGVATNRSVSVDWAAAWA